MCIGARLIWQLVIHSCVIFALFCLIRWRKQWLAWRRSLLPRSWSRVLIPFPFPFKRLPRRLVRCEALCWAILSVRHWLIPLQYSVIMLMQSDQWYLFYFFTSNNDLVGWSRYIPVRCEALMLRNPNSRHDWSLLNSRREALNKNKVRCHLVVLSRYTDICGSH